MNTLGVLAEASPNAANTSGGIMHIARLLKLQAVQTLSRFSANRDGLLFERLLGSFSGFRL